MYVVPNFRYVGPYVGISDPKSFKNRKFWKLVLPGGANPSIDIHEIYKFYAPMGSTKMFKFGVIRCLTKRVIGRKPQSGNFHQNFQGPLAQKLWVRSEKVTRCKNETDVLYAHAKFYGDRWTHGDRRWKTIMFFLFVCLYFCMFVTLDVQKRGPDVEQRIMSPFVDQFQCGFHCFYRKTWAF